MPQVHVFTDGSVNTITKVGYGACLVVGDLDSSLSSLKELVWVKRFEDTSSTKLELQTLLWILSEILTKAHEDGASVTIYTDSQNIVSLPSRRARIEANDYLSSQHKYLNNHELYKEFYRVTSALECEFVKVAGHMPSIEKDEVDRIFTLVDQASRRALRAG